MASTRTRTASSSLKQMQYGERRRDIGLGLAGPLEERQGGQTFLRPVVLPDRTLWGDRGSLHSQDDGSEVEPIQTALPGSHTSSDVASGLEAPHNTHHPPPCWLRAH